jgi:hypothetical protein
MMWWGWRYAASNAIIETKHRNNTPEQNTGTEHRNKTPKQNTETKHRNKTPEQNTGTKLRNSKPRQSILLAFEHDLHNQPSPAGHIVSLDLYCPAGSMATFEYPRSKPPLDFRGQMAEKVSARQMHPNSGRVIDRGTWNEQDFIAYVNPIEMFGTLAEDRAVNGRAEARRGVRRKWWRMLLHDSKLNSHSERQKG